MKSHLVNIQLHKFFTLANSDEMFLNFQCFFNKRSFWKLQDNEIILKLIHNISYEL